MTALEITLRDVYDQVSAISTQIGVFAGHLERVDARLESGSTDLADHEARLRMIEAELPRKLDERVAALERFRFTLVGAAMLASTITGVAAAFIEYAVTHH